MSRTRSARPPSTSWSASRSEIQRSVSKWPAGIRPAAGVASLLFLLKDLQQFVGIELLTCEQPGCRRADGHVAGLKRLAEVAVAAD